MGRERERERDRQTETETDRQRQTDGCRVGVRGKERGEGEKNCLGRNGGV